MDSTYGKSLVETVLAAHGRCSISCDCGSQEMWIDADISQADFEKAQRLIEHAAFDHVGRRSIIMQKPVDVLDTETLYGRA